MGGDLLAWVWDVVYWTDDWGLGWKDLDLEHETAGGSYRHQSYSTLRRLRSNLIQISLLSVNLGPALAPALARLGQHQRRRREMTTAVADWWSFDCEVGRLHACSFGEDVRLKRMSCAHRAEFGFRRCCKYQTRSLHDWSKTMSRHACSSSFSQSRRSLGR